MNNRLPNTNGVHRNGSHQRAQRVGPSGFDEIVCCPMCGASLDEWTCAGCGCQYPCVEGQPDLRLQKPKDYQLGLVLNGAPSSKHVTFMTRNKNATLNLPPEVSLGIHFDASLASYLPPGNGDYILDLGCGQATSRAALEHAGYQYVSLDYSSKKAQVLGDAHALPFKDQSFRTILCLAVLEHLQHPYVALREAFRVLKPGGVMLGTVAFLEPWHENSYYHHSPLGTLNTLIQAGFEVVIVAPEKEWPVLRAQSRMGLFPGLPHFAAQALVAPLHALHRLYWAAGRLASSNATELKRQMTTTGAFYFVGRRPA